MESAMRRLQYQCFFCGKTIEPNECDPCSLIVVTGWDGPADRQHEQQFFCHAEHLRSAAHPSVPLYVLDLCGGTENSEDG